MQRYFYAGDLTAVWSDHFKTCDIVRESTPRGSAGWLVGNIYPNQNGFMVDMPCYGEMFDADSLTDAMEMAYMITCDAASSAA